MSGYGGMAFVTLPSFACAFLGYKLGRFNANNLIKEIFLRREWARLLMSNAYIINYIYEDNVEATAGLSVHH